MALQAKQIIVTLPVKDVNKTIDFFTKVGFAFNPQFTDENAAYLIIGENIFAMLLVESLFKSFIKKEIVDATKQTEAIIAIYVASREQVDEIVNKALNAGGKPANDPMDHGFMYSWSFQDLDGHMWEAVYMDESAVNQAKPLKAVKKEKHRSVFSLLKNFNRLILYRFSSPIHRVNMV